MNGYTYTYEYDVDDDVRKIYHMVISPDGETNPIPWSPYEYMDEDDFKLWIHLGMPQPTKGSNFRKSTLIEFLTESLS